MFFQQKELFQKKVLEMLIRDYKKDLKVTKSKNGEKVTTLTN